jgi:hypothetical protein
MEVLTLKIFQNELMQIILDFLYQLLFHFMLI